MKEHDLLKINYDKRSKMYLAVCTCWKKVPVEPSSLIGKTRAQQEALALLAIVQECHGS